MQVIVWLQWLSEEFPALTCVPSLDNFRLCMHDRSASKNIVHRGLESIPDPRILYDYTRQFGV